MGRNKSELLKNGMDRILINVDKKRGDMLRRLAKKCNLSLSEIVLYYLWDVEDIDWKLILKWLQERKIYISSPVIFYCL